MISAMLLPSDLRRPDLLGHVSHGSAVKPARLGYSLGAPGRPAEFPTLLIVIADDSGSVTSPVGADPVSNRYQEARRAFHTVAQNGGNHELGAVLHFDTPCSGDIPPAPLTRAGLRRLDRGLQVPSDAAGTSVLAPSLTSATQLAKSYPNHLATLVLLSDFELFDLDPAEVLSDLASFPGQVHAVVLGGRLPVGVLDAKARMTSIQAGDQPGAVARAMFASLTAHRPGARAD